MNDGGGGCHEAYVCGCDPARLLRGLLYRLFPRVSLFPLIAYSRGDEVGRVGPSEGWHRVLRRQMPRGSYRR